jgi:transcriptional regulator with XRE-family HTH domain
MVHLGKGIRERRRELKKTLKDIADATGFSIGFLSQVERNLTAPSLTSLAKIARELGVSIGELTGPAEEPHSVTYHDQRVPFTLQNGIAKYERLSSVFPGSLIHALKCIWPVGYHSEVNSHEGEDLFLVLHGTVCFTVAENKYVLAVGDSIHIDANVIHSVMVMPESNGAAEVLWCGTIDLFNQSKS